MHRLHINTTITIVPQKQAIQCSFCPFLQKNEHRSSFYVQKSPYLTKKSGACLLKNRVASVVPSWSLCVPHAGHVLLMSSNPRSRLNGLFQDAATTGGGNDALRYTAPREPIMKPQQQPPAAASAVSSSPAASTVVYSTMVSLYQYDASERKYVQLGGATAGTKAAVGCVIVGAETSYTLLFYNAAKHHLCTLPLKFSTFNPTLQAKSYVNFYDDHSQNWSIKFPNDSQVSDFMRHVFLAKLHVEIWGLDKSVTKTHPSALIQDDLVFVKPELPAVTTGDMVAVAFQAWRVVGNASSLPTDVVTKYPPFETANTKNELRKFRLGDATERFKALDEGILGMKKGGKRILVAPPGKTNGHEWYLFEIELLKTKSSASRLKATLKNTQETSKESVMESIHSPSQHSNRHSMSTPIPRNHLESFETPRDLVPYQDEVSLNNALNREHFRYPHYDSAFENPMQDRDQRYRDGFHSYETNRSSLLRSTPSVQFSSQLDHSLATQVSEMHAKIDALLRIPSSRTIPSGQFTGSYDVTTILSGIERLASENERLGLQLNAHSQQHLSLEKRYDLLMEQYNRLQLEKESLETRYEALERAQQSALVESHAITRAKDAAVTQTNHLQAEYQELLTAYAQLAHHQTNAEISIETSNQVLGVEVITTRNRLEHELKHAIQARELLEQELVLIQQEHHVALQVAASEARKACVEMEDSKWHLETAFKASMEEIRRLKSVLEAPKDVLLSESNEVLKGMVQEERLRWVALVNESMKAMVVQLHELLEEEKNVDGTHVLHVIRKVLKAGTRRMIEELQEKVYRVKNGEEEGGWEDGEVVLKEDFVSEKEIGE
ncbi:hypothetical protein CCR75_001630 [Bremia lactucae]|uniref:peptidylprolyl isomerase n=1 Tax=Bremia lactucae TaxID=4779 RepID=A0A976IF86_BRELC|nr:hypothetical protein CCR75_001630 [Bremia lactucae]